MDKPHHGVQSCSKHTPGRAHATTKAQISQLGSVHGGRRRAGSGLRNGRRQWAQRKIHTHLVKTAHNSQGLNDQPGPRVVHCRAGCLCVRRPINQPAPENMEARHRLLHDARQQWGESTGEEKRTVSVLAQGLEIPHAQLPICVQSQRVVNLFHIRVQCLPASGASSQSCRVQRQQEHMYLRLQ